MENIYTMGIDVGSTASKCIILKNGKEIISKSLVDSGTGTTGPARAIESVLKDCDLTKEDMNYILATGYGRNSIDWVDAEMSELSCHAKAAHFLFPNVRTVIDIGGQDAKVLRISEQGMLTNFAMNDKCAAGTGRFLDVMARILEVNIDDLEVLSAQSTKVINISSTCTVFAESEVISQLAHDSQICDIVKGIHRSVAGRVSGLAKRVGVEDDVVMSGGVARNKGVVTSLEEELGKKIHTSPLAQYSGALGAALFAYQKFKK
ncbi:(R)-2-hydroxyglutaryl-CoA dehydratase activase HgdC [Anaerophilus nitritogenes]|uniref:(R)-2-hydroxyglutaryl-CoA dehydratase activase HgdC n=1 Tax=Anaerophilus nitritogenes TaxID=2498136 RepID=UPI00101DFB0D|nr:(R)-2-hydroxyglutaryl-CoA dehydratase activase HgdC [Anaerophilus nitritogenes]